MIDINWHPSRRDLRIFSALLIVFFGIIAILIGRRGESTTAAWAVFGAAAVVGVFGLIFPRLIRPVYLGWMLAGFPIGWVVSHAILLAIFVFVFTPIGLLLRWTGRDSMQRKMDRSASSYWEPRTSQREAQDYFRQF